MEYAKNAGYPIYLADARYCLQPHAGIGLCPPPLTQTEALIRDGAPKFCHL
jgi:hypothetical protein